MNLDFWKGAKIGLIGKNGCGKSSLLKIIAGLDNQFEGHAEVTGRVNFWFETQNLSLCKPPNRLQESLGSPLIRLHSF